MNALADWLVENRDEIEKGVEIMGQVSEVLASTVGKFHPILEAVFKASSEFLRNPESREVRYLTQQFGLVNQKLWKIHKEINHLVLEIREIGMNMQNFDSEVQMISQYEKFQDFVTADPEAKERKMKKFLNHYENTDRDLNLNRLYNSVTGENLTGEPMLKTLVEIKKKDRRAVENFCAQLKRLFMVGIIAVLGHTALKEGEVREEMLRRWQDRMENVENRMKAAVDDCTQNFATQAKLDLEEQLPKLPKTISAEFTQSLLDHLVRKYDWVSWSIRAFNDEERIFFFNWLAGEKYHGVGGNNWFEIVTNYNVKVVVSFSVDPQPINRQEIHEHIERQKLKRNKIQVAQALSNTFSSRLVHAFSYYKEVVEKNNFQAECYYSGKHQQTLVWIHSDGEASVPERVEEQ